MYTNTQNRVMVYGILSDDFLVQLGLYQGSILSPYGVIYHNTHLEKLGQDVQKNYFVLMMLH